MKIKISVSFMKISTLGEEEGNPCCPLWECAVGAWCLLGGEYSAQAGDPWDGSAGRWFVSTAACGIELLRCLRGG